jgi:tetratricopeptide (TPR) repeat protein
MRQLRIRLAVVGLFPLAGLLSVGCDSESGRADKDVARQIAQAERNSDPEGRLRAIDVASQVNAASATTQVHVKDLLGDEVLAKARVAHANADGYAATITGLLLSLDRMTDDIADATNAIDSLKKFEPVQPKADIATKLKGLTEGDGGVWVPPLQALTAVKGTAADLQSKISETESKVKQLNEQRAAALAEAESLQQRSESAKGRESVDLYKQSAAKRKEAMDLTAQADVTATSLIALRQDLAIAQGQEAQRAAAIAGFEKANATIDAGWQGVQTASATIASDAKGIATGEATGPGSVAATTAELVRAFDEYEKNLADAKNQYDLAIGHYERAVAAARQLNSELTTLIGQRGTAPEVEAFKAMQVTISPFPLDLKRGTAQQGLAMMQARQATVLQARQRVMTRLASTLNAVGVQPPAGVTTEGLEEATKEATAAAVQSFEEATGTLRGNAETGGSTAGAKSAKGNSAVALMLAEYNWSQFATTLGDTAAATSHLQSAKAARDMAVEDGKTLLPALPPDLALPPAPAPATSPAPAPGQ